ncbi:MAG: IPT/TIG domain-containing protein [Bacteroidales bacterium]|jgi:DNA-binding beta-propeller fold protein YncE|nr:IPT/TIG domain-containing protein [Bacteroidales bacterium]
MKIKSIGLIFRQTAVLLSLGCFAFMSCKHESNGGLPDYDPAKPVVLSAFHPETGRIAERMILEGDNFGSDPSRIKVYFNQKKAAVITASGNRIHALAPRMPGDTCIVSVVVGQDSTVYEQPFLYNISVSVSTITGNGTAAFKGGTLAEATLKPQHLCVDDEDNIFIAVRESNDWGLVKVNEAENNVMSLIMGASSLIIPNALCPDVSTGIIYVPCETAITAYYTCNPKEAWAPRLRNFTWRNTNSYSLPSNPWKHSMGFCKLDGYVYTRFFDGQIVKIDPKTNDADIIYLTPNGTTVGCTFDPLHPEMLYIAGRSGGMVGGIYSMDVRDPAGTFQRLNAAGSGYRDGELSTALFYNPWQIFFDPDGNLYIADADNHCIRRIRADHFVETVVGMPGTAGMENGGKDDAQFNQPRGVGVGKDGTVYVADYGNSRLRKLAIE